MKQPKLAPRHLLSVALVGFCLEALGGVELVDGNRLAAVVERVGYCCVVDARGAGARVDAPIEQAIAWRQDLQLKPEAAVVVIGASDEAALRIGEEIARRSGARDVIVVQGGERTWRAFLREMAAGPPSGMAFIVPRNTCEPGAAVLELKSD